MKRFLSGNHGVAEAVRLCRIQFVAAYPITPQTPIYEKLSEWEAKGELGGRMMRVESEHSAMAACLSASLAGARTYTASASQGIALMHEMLHFASGCRTPVVMTCVNRTLAAPWAFWSDQTDALSQRDTGWIQFFAEDNQEALDTTIQAFKLAEEVLLPVMVSIEANYISHFMEPIDVPSQELVDSYLPAVNIPKRFELDNPGYAVPAGSAKTFRNSKRLASEAFAYAVEAAAKVDREFSGVFGRSYGLVESVDCEGADMVLLTTATITSTVRATLEILKERGQKVGLVKLRLFRPFPTAEVRAALENAERIAVIERNISLGREGIFCSEVKAALVNSKKRHQVQGYLAGIGGTDVNVDTILRIVADAFGREEFSDEPIWVTEDEP